MLRASDVLSRQPESGKRGRARPRGFVSSWRPRAETLLLLEQVEEVFTIYVDQLPLSVRQTFYVLVGRGHLPKTEKAYKRLGEHLVMARRAGRIPFENIRDDGADLPSLTGWGEDALVPLLRGVARRFEVDPQLGQPCRIVLWCEAAGMRPQLERVARPYGVPVIAGGGFDSLTAKFDAAQEMARSGQAFEVLHIGDLDDSGEDIFTALSEDVPALAAGLDGEPVRFSRLAVTPEQVTAYGLPTAVGGGRLEHTVQAEAIPPDELARIVRDALEQRLDPEAREAARQATERARAAALALLEGRP